MRLHRLTLQAFGPYADRQTVDFDELNDAGVFLLAGPTGAGKTSILDAVCFALYGVVPGERHVRGLRSDHAGPEVAPLVELELTLGGRRLRVERAPEWQRPKRRGEGTTTERARGKLFEVGAGGERLVSDRLQEIGHELGPLLGMSADQFQQVVLLPQGGFSTFLHAGSDQRREVLERLFATQRFAHIESWVQDRAGQLRRRAEESRQHVLRLLATTAHRAGHPVPDEIEPTVLAQWREGVLAEAAAEVGRTSAVEQRAREQESGARSVLREVELAHSAAGRRAAARAQLADLSASQAVEDEVLARLRDHRRAGSVVPLLEPLSEAEARVAAADRAAQVAAARLAAPLDQDACEVEATRLQRRLGELESLREVVDDLAATRRRRTRLTAQVAEAARLVEELAEEAEALPVVRAEAAERLERCHRVLTRRDDCERALETAIGRRRAAEQLDAARRRCDEARALVTAAHERANQAVTVHLDLVDRRLRGMAAELAGQLVDAHPCPVCGSAEHPSPASLAPGAVTRHQQEEAERGARLAREEHERARAEAATADQQRALLEHAAAGLDLQAATEAEHEAAQEVDRVLHAEADAEAASSELAQLEARIQDLAARAQRAREAREELAGGLAAVEELVALAQPRVEAVLGRGRTLASAIAATTEDLAHVQAASRATSDRAAAERHHRECRQRAETAAAAAGFGDIEQATAAVLDQRTESELESELESRGTRRARALGVLEEPSVRALEQSATPHGDDDLAAARLTADDAGGALTDAVADGRAARERHVALLALADQLTAAVTAWVPAREEHELAESMSRLVRGTGGDNHLQMRLSSYVLATRLDQVLEAANERLVRMRDNRYTFHRAARAPSARVRSGLDLDVLDDWTGEARPPSTLSGGETFKLSLALALGLADVITHESGGLHLETLFIDEGFGMLDADTLDEVMDCIDDLRSGGRAVGVVSHVTELRARISTQLHVTPTRRGSSVELASSFV